MAQTRPGDEAVLVLSAGWVLDDLAAERMRHQLAGSPETVRGIAAATGALPAGASYRVHAERQALLPLSATSPAVDAQVRGAVALRPGVGHEVRDGLITFDAAAGDLLVDWGAHVHDPNGVAAPVGPATQLSTSPFPWRPIVAFVAGTAAGDLADWARVLVNELLDHDVEGRLVMSEVARGPHLTAACTPGDESIEVLRPDVVVPLDARATDAVARWTAREPSMTIIEFVDSVSGVETVSWRLGASSGRVRGRVGRAVDADQFASFVKRLCAGPHPLSLPEPVDVSLVRREWREGIGTLVSAIRPSRPVAVARPSVVAVTDSSDPVSGRVEGLLDHLDALGFTTDLRHLSDGWPRDLGETDLVIVDSITPPDEAIVFLEDRRLRGRPTVVDVRPGNEAILDLAAASGLAVSPSEDVVAHLIDKGVRTQLLPTLMTRDRDVELRALRHHQAVRENVLGWRIDRGPSLDQVSLEALAKAVNRLLEHDPALQLVVVDHDRQVPEVALEFRDRVEVLAVPPSPAAATLWVAQVWTTPDLGALDELSPLVEASHLGLPTIIGGRDHEGVVALHPAELVVDRSAESDAWIEAVGPLLAEASTRERISRDVARRSDALVGARASSAVVNRLLGWLGMTRP